MALPMMTATQVASSIAENTGISKTDVQHVLADYADLVLSELENSNRVKILGIVQLEPKVKPARKKRMGRNPRTGEDVEVPAKPAESTVRARVLKPGKDAAPPLATLRKRISATTVTRKKPTQTKKARPKVKSRR